MIQAFDSMAYSYRADIDELETALDAEQQLKWKLIIALEIALERIEINNSGEDEEAPFIAAIREAIETAKGG